MGEDRAETGRRYTVAEAARLLDTTAEAIRSRIKRGTLQSVKEGATVYVLLSPDQTPPELRPAQPKLPPGRNLIAAYSYPRCAAA